MAKKSGVTTELANVFPPWAKIRTDELSTGNRVLNAFAVQMEEMETELVKAGHNQYLATANLNEIDLTYKVTLPRDYEFDEDTTDPLKTLFIPPTVSGKIDDIWLLLELAEDNDLKSFWYTSIPSRVTLGDVISGVDHLLISEDVIDFPQSGYYRHHLGGGALWVEATGGVQYLEYDGEELHRGRVKIEGVTRKGTTEDETLVFPWDMKQKTVKEWKEVHAVSTYDIEDDVLIEVRSADFNTPPYLSFWNFNFSVNKTKIDQFWDLGTVGNIPTLDKVRYISDEWQQLVLGFSEKTVVESWELLDGLDGSVDGVDMAIQPFTDIAWVVTAGNVLYSYDMSEETMSGMMLLKGNTPGANVTFDIEEQHIVLGEDLNVTPWHIRPLKGIQDYRIWFQKPDGTKYGILDGQQVDYASDFTVKILQSSPLTRTIGDLITLPATQRGEYLFVLEVTFDDGEEQVYKTLIKVNFKQPIASIDLNAIVPTAIDGIDFDSDQQMWVKSGSDYYRIDLHYDVMLIDYDRKVIYFKEQYDEVDVDSDV